MKTETTPETAISAPKPETNTSPLFDLAEEVAEKERLRRERDEEARRRRMMAD